MIADCFFKIQSCFQLLIRMWNDQLNSLSGAEIGTKGKLALATLTQTQIYLKPLFRKLKSKKLPEDILDSLTIIIKHLLDRNYIMVSFPNTYMNEDYVRCYKIL